MITINVYKITIDDEIMYLPGDKDTVVDYVKKYLDLEFEFNMDYEIEFAYSFNTLVSR